MSKPFLLGLILLLTVIATYQTAVILALYEINEARSSCPRPVSVAPRFRA